MLFLHFGFYKDKSYSLVSFRGAGGRVLLLER